MIPLRPLTDQKVIATLNKCADGQVYELSATVPRSAPSSPKRGSYLGEHAFALHHVVQLLRFLSI